VRALLLASFFAIFCYSITLTSCSKHETNVERGDRDKILFWGNGTEPQDLDPHVTTGMPEAYIQTALFEPLVSSDPKTLAPTSGVAESWTINADQTVYTFHLRSNARWSNGDPVTADDFVWSYKRAVMPRLGNQYSYMYAPIKNIDQFAKGEITDFNDVGVKALNKNTLEITLNSPTPYFLGLLSHHSFYPVNRKAIEQYGSVDEQGNQWTRPGNMITNGPFMLKEWKLFKHVAVEKNPYYWNADQVKLNEVRFLPTENITTEERMFRAGQLHFSNDLPTNKIEKYKTEHPELLNNDPFLATYFYRLNTNKPPMDNLKVRRALAMAIDRNQLVEKVTKAGQIPAYNITPPDTNGYTADTNWGYDPELARQLLVEAGYPKGVGIPVIELLYNTSEGHRKVAVALQQMWKSELGIDISLRNEDWKVFLSSVNQKNYHMARASWVGDYVDPNTFLDMWITDGGNNNTGWSNAEFDRLILKDAATAKTQQQRYDYFRQAERILMEEMPIIPFYIYTSKHLKSPSLKGAYPNLSDRYFFHHMSLEPDQVEEEQ